MIDPNDPNYKLLNNTKIDLNNIRMVIVELQKDGFREVGLADLLWLIKSAELKKSVDS
jgi:hypothetical protein